MFAREAREEASIILPFASSEGQDVGRTPFTWCSSASKDMFFGELGKILVKSVEMSDRRSVNSFETSYSVTNQKSFKSGSFRSLPLILSPATRELNDRTRLNIIVKHLISSPRRPYFAAIAQRTR